MDATVPASAPMKSPTNSFAVFSLALSLLPTLAYFATLAYFSRSYERTRVFFDSHAGAGLNQLLIISLASAFAVVVFAALAGRRHPGSLANTAFIVALAALLCLIYLPSLFPMRIR